MSINASNPALYELIVEHARDVLCLVESTGIIRFVTPSATEAFGYAPADIVGTSLLGYVHPEDRKHAAEAYDRVLSGEQWNASVVVRLLHAGGDTRFVEFAGNVVDLEGSAGALLHARDVTDKQAQINALLHSEEAFEAAFNATSTLSAISVPETGEHLNVNDAWLATLGWKREEVIGRTALELNVWGSAENRARVLGALRERGSLKQFRAALYTREGEPRNVLVDAKYLELAAGTVVYFSAIDVTERDEFEEQLRQSQKMEAIGQLTGGIAHDFNNLLNVIMGNAELAEEDLGRGGDVRESIFAISEAAERGAHLIRQLLSFSRKQTLSPKRFNVGEHLMHSRALLSTSLGKDVELEIAAHDDGWLCHLDPVQLDSAMLNLVINARDAMPEGGTLTITSNRLSIAGDIDWQGNPIAPGDYVQLEVRDSGHGIPPGALDRIFEPFFTTKADRGGTGLGLSMVFGFVKQSGGYIWVGSEESGTAVQLLLPRVEGPVAEPPGLSQTAIPVRHYGRKAILVEDDEGVRRLVARMLRALELDVLEAESGEQALVLADPAVEIVVTDVMLPGSMKGPDVARRLLETSPSAAVLFISGYDQGLLSARHFASHRVRFLPKPFSRTELTAAVDDLIALAR